MIVMRLQFLCLNRISSDITTQFLKSHHEALCSIISNSIFNEELKKTTEVGDCVAKVTWTQKVVCQEFLLAFRGLKRLFLVHCLFHLFGDILLSCLLACTYTNGNLVVIISILDCMFSHRSISFM